jgi:hypothetical protein
MEAEVPSELAFLRLPKPALANGEFLEMPGDRVGARVACREGGDREQLQEHADAGGAELLKLRKHYASERGPPDRTHADRTRRGAQRAPADPTFASRGLFHVDAAFSRSTKAATSARGA